MLFVCPSCERRYQETVAGPVRCLCGQLISSAVTKPFYPEIVRCSSCGGSVDGNTFQCRYCENIVHEFDGRSYCLKCFAFLEKRAKFCSSCGETAIKIDALPLAARLFCPRDGGELSGFQLGDYRISKCNACFGVWISKEEFRRIVDAKAEGVEIDGEYARRSKFDSELKYISCPECAKQLARRNYERVSGVIIDTCEEHGVWLDVHELEDVANFLKKGGKHQAASARKAEEKRLKSEHEKVRRMKAQLRSGEIN